MATAIKEKRAPAKNRSVPGNKAQYAQYFTPTAVADFMAQMFSVNSQNQAKILDPGAGEGVLGLTLFKKLASQKVEPSVTMVEVDGQVFQALKANTGKFCTCGTVDLIQADFMEEGFRLFHEGQRYSHIIMNPPYFKIQRNSAVSGYLMSCGVNVTNIYAAFMWLGLMLLSDNGQMVAIVPRSFCNGPYFQKFREYVARNASIEAIHTFGARDRVFSKDKILQENVMIRLAKKPQSSTVTITYSADQCFTDIQEMQFDSREVFDKETSDLTISIPQYQTKVQLRDYAEYSLPDLELSVSTGPVVDFRAKDFIAWKGADSSVPLLYPAHMKDGHIVWPIESFTKKGQYYVPQPDLWNGTEASLCGDRNVSPSDGYYVAVRRFSSKEEKRRIFAAVVDPLVHPNGVAFENHLNYFHKNKHGFDQALAYGLSAYLNSAPLDECFRSFSGHTQVNATDLRNLPYPSEGQLKEIGHMVLEKSDPIETVVTEKVLRECA